MSDTPPSVPAAPAGDDNTPAIIGYLFGIGLVIAAIMHSSKKTQLGAFHLRQALGILIIAIAGSVLFFILEIMFALLGGIPVIGWFLINVLTLLAWAFRLGLVIFTVLGLMAAANREQKPLPIIGATCQKLFTSVFA